MNPHIKYGQINASALYLANSTADYNLDGVRGAGVGMITFDDMALAFIDGLYLLEQFPKLQTSLPTELKTDIETTIAGAKNWLTSFIQWMDTSSVAFGAQLIPNNHGSWYLSAYSSIPIYLNNTTYIAKTKEYIKVFYTNNTALASRLSKTGVEGYPYNGYLPSFYQQLNSSGDQVLEYVRGLSFHYQ